MGPGHDPGALLPQALFGIGSELQTPGDENPTTWVTTTSSSPVPSIASRNRRAVVPDVLATTMRRRPRSRARPTAIRAASAVFSSPGTLEIEDILPRERHDHNLLSPFI